MAVNHVAAPAMNQEYAVASRSGSVDWSCGTWSCAGLSEWDTVSLLATEIEKGDREVR
jgi:hypothetical protein